MELGLDDVDLADEDPSLYDPGSNVIDTTTSQLSAVCDPYSENSLLPSDTLSPVEVPAPLSDGSPMDSQGW